MNERFAATNTICPRPVLMRNQQHEVLVAVDRILPKDLRQVE
jgi:hypothetical protein